MHLYLKNIILSCFLVFPLILCAQSNFEKFSKDLIRQNRIRSITEWSHHYQGNIPASKGTKNSVARYDRNGNLTEEISYNARGEETRKLTYRYDIKGNKTEYTVFEARFNRITFSQFANYDNAGNRLSEWGFDGLGNYRNNYTLDKDGNIQEILFTNQGRITEKRVFRTSAFETEINLLNQGKIPSGRIILKYDRSKRLIEESESDTHGNIVRKVTYTYNPSGQLIQETRFRGNNLAYSNNHRYNSRGQITETEREEASLNPVVIHKYSYDSSGRLAEEQWYSENAKDYSSRKYQYDNKNNITSMDCYFVSYKFRILYKFTIEYY